jgi:hypothetical protein
VKSGPPITRLGTLLSCTKPRRAIGDAIPGMCVRELSQTLARPGGLGTRGCGLGAEVEVTTRAKTGHRIGRDVNRTEFPRDSFT